MTTSYFSSLIDSRILEHRGSNYLIAGEKQTVGIVFMVRTI